VDAAAPVKARIVNLKRLIIQRGDQVIANMPVSVARPGLRGRGTWLVLESVLRPRLVSTGPESAPFPTPVTLPAGPNNPAGIAWLQLAKATDPKPLPYGLHGTSIPGYMFKQESIGGFRMTNWDLARVMKLLPVGTELNWE
jgi:lipoprotein-anchoring transpeptidase ErfK/SrfK